MTPQKRRRYKDSTPYLPMSDYNSLQQQFQRLSDILSEVDKEFSQLIDNYTKSPSNLLRDRIRENMAYHTSLCERRRKIADAIETFHAQQLAQLHI